MCEKAQHQRPPKLHPITRVLRLSIHGSPLSRNRRRAKSFAHRHVARIFAVAQRLQLRRQIPGSREPSSVARQLENLREVLRTRSNAMMKTRIIVLAAGVFCAASLAAGSASAMSRGGLAAAGSEASGDLQQVHWVCGPFR